MEVFSVFETFALILPSALLILTNFIVKAQKEEIIERSAYSAFKKRHIYDRKGLFIIPLIPLK